MNVFILSSFILSCTFCLCWTKSADIPTDLVVLRRNAPRLLGEGEDEFSTLPDDPTTPKAVTKKKKDDDSGEDPIPTPTFNISKFILQIEAEVKSYIEELQTLDLDKEETTEVTNDFVDNVLRSLRKLIREDMEPFPLPDYDGGFDYTVLFIRTQGQFSMTNGHFNNLSSIERDGDVYIRKFGKKITVKIPLNLRKIPFLFDYAAKLYGVGPTGQIYGHLERIQGSLELKINPKTKKLMKADLKVIHHGHLKFGFKGGILINSVLNVLKQVVAIIVDRVVMILFDNFITQEMNTFVTEVNEALSDFIDI